MRQIISREPRVAAALRDHLLRHLPGGALGGRPDAVPGQGERQHGQRPRRRGGRIAAHCAAVHEGRIFPAAPVGLLLRRIGLLLVGAGGQQLRASRPSRRGPWPDRRIPGRPQGRQAGGAGHRGMVPEGPVPGRPQHRRAMGRCPQRPGAGLGRNDVRCQEPDAATAVRAATGRRPMPTSWPSSSRTTPRSPNPQPSDLAVVFFETFSKENPGRFPSAVTANGPDGKPVTKIQPVKDGSDIQSNFFDMWRQEHPDIALQDVPGDLVTTSASGLDPHITLQNAEYQLDRVASKWAADLKRDPAEVRQEIESLLQGAGVGAARRACGRAVHQRARGQSPAPQPIWDPAAITGRESFLRRDRLGVFLRLSGLHGRFFQRPAQLPAAKGRAPP